MIIHYMSASRLKTYLQCTQKYHEQYENKIRGDAEHLRFGTLMHKVFERYFQEDLDIKEIYDEEWQQGTVVSPALYKDGHEILDIFVTTNNRDEITPIGFEMPFAIDILNNVVIDTDSVDFNNPDEMRAFLKKLEEIEAPIIFGYIDRLDYVAENDSIRIVDYKTSRVPLSQDEANEDIQLSMYALVADYLFPEYSDVSLELHYVRFGSAVRTKRTAEELATFKQWLTNLYYTIKKDDAPLATLNKYCGWCDAKHGCVAYRELIENGSDAGNNIEDFTQLDEELEKVNAHIKILNDRKKELTELFKEVLKETDNDPINAGGNERYLTNNARVSYDINTVLELFPDKLDDILEVKKGKVDELAKDDSYLRHRLDQTSQQYFISPTLRRRKKKGD